MTASQTSSSAEIQSCKEWLALAGAGASVGVVSVGLVGVPIGKACISINRGWTTPPVFREQLGRYPTWNAQQSLDLGKKLTLRDFGDVEGDEHDPDATQAHRRIEQFVGEHKNAATVLVLVGGDNSLTRPAMRGLAGPDNLSEGWGLITVDAHHDTRPVENGLSRNGTPVRELIMDGLPASRVAQVGIQPFGNNAETSGWAREQGIHIHFMSEVRERGIDAVMESALGEVRAAGAKRIYFDFDVDVHDIAFAPGCPASMPGGFTPDMGELAALHMGRQEDVVAMDLTEVDASRDGGPATARLMGALFLNFCTGVASRHAQDRR